MTTPIAALAARLALSAEGAITRQLALNKQVAAAKVLWPKATVTPVGSFPQNTSLVGSDLDVVVHIPNKVYSASNAGDWAVQLRRALIEHRVTLRSTSGVLKTARVPILTYTDLESNVGVDVSFLPNSIANTEYVRNELVLRPYMRTLLILLKYWLKSRGMNKVFTGGLGSYALSLMVIGYFNVRKHTKARKVTRETYEQWLVDENMYYLLVDCLTFWGSQWKYASRMLEPADGGIYKKGSAGRIGGRNSLLAIADPTDPKNDVGSKSLKATKIKAAMKLLKDKLLEAGPDITEEKLLELLTNTGIMFKGADWGHGMRKGVKKGSKNAKRRVKSPKKLIRMVKVKKVETISGELFGGRV